MSKTDEDTEDRLPRRMFMASIGILIFIYGFMAGSLQWFPYGWINLAMRGMSDLHLRIATRYDPASLADKNMLPNYLKKASPRPETVAGSATPEDLTLVTYINDDLIPSAALIDGSGKQVHYWNLDWFRLWEDPTHLAENAVPKSRPGCHIHGAVLLEGRKLVFNFSGLGLMCVDRNGDEVWRLPYATHHSLHLADDGNLWASGKVRHEKPDSNQPARRLPFDEYTVLEVSPSGELLNEWSVDKILIDSGYGGMMSMPTAKPDSLYADDLLHLNDAEPFPDHFEPGVFKPGDVMVSLRNINSIMVFDRETRRVRYMISGAFDGQHDPDFIDGNRFSVFDNNRISISATHQTSKISIVDARDNSIEVIYEGKEPNIFYTAFAGKHQWLPNGHLLISESCEGRAFELNPDMEIVWQYRKYVDDDIVTLLTQADRLDSKELSLRSQHVNPSKQSEP